MDTPTIIDILKIGIIYTLLLVIIFLLVAAFIQGYSFLLDNFDEVVLKKKEQYTESMIGSFFYCYLRYVLLPFLLILHNIGAIVFFWEKEAVPAIAMRLWQNPFDWNDVFILCLYIGISISAVCADVLLVKRRQQVMQLLWGKE